MSVSTFPRVLHIVESLNNGAVENWLVRMLGHARDRGIAVDWTFYCVLGGPGALDEQARSLGARVIYSPAPLGQKARFARALRAHLKSGQYDVLHCHHDLVSAVYLLISLGVGIRKKLVHVHNADESVPTRSHIKQALFRWAMRRACLLLADEIVGISSHTLDTFLEGRTRRAGRDIVHYYGVDPRPFCAAPSNRAELRRWTDVAEDALILLFAGRLVPEKNPAFVTEVLVELRRLEPRSVAIFVGAGPLEKAVLKRARECRLENAIRLVGWRNDLPEIMSCCDWFILPHPEHPKEGFGLAVVEAQLAGLPLLLSTGISDDPLLPGASFRRLALSRGPAAWADAALELSCGPAPSRAAAIAALKESPMDMGQALEKLCALHT